MDEEKKIEQPQPILQAIPSQGQKGERVYYTFAGDITKDNVAQAIHWLVNTLIQKKGNVSEIIVLISSNGGDLDASVRFYEFLKMLPYKVITMGFGQVESGGVIIFLAGEKRHCTNLCRFFIHKGTVTIDVPTLPLDAHQESIKVAEARVRQMIKIIAMETGKSEEDIGKELDAGSIFIGEEAKNFGFVHEVIEQIEDFFKN